ncbi:Putative membrane protein YdgH [Salinivirga cyanobacteriivorans]|uniref:Membrane protein YdgH n=1 Tax=Salinivirga cyanobacteriivorans TaxID=1307839 RepID=A0A0S2I480_9BACT|nr:MMPL family transporter [Salinivirga cyanobacteriivorans]ALO16796.1 Putative membrane protein YdgH [Salinivirga cyanobacteriivorans]
MKKLSKFTIRFRWPIILFFLAISLFTGSQIKNATMNSDMMTYLPDDMPSRVNKRKVEELFGGTEMLMLIVKSEDVINSSTLKRVHKFSREMSRIKGVDKVLSLFDLKYVRNEDGAMMVDPAVKKLPRTAEDIKEIKSDLKNNDMVYGNVVSKDFTTTAVIALLEPDVSDKEMVEKFQQLIDSIPGDEEVVIGGTPFSRMHTAKNTMKDLGRLLPLGLLIMLVFLFICFKQFRGVWLPFVVVLMSIFVSMGIIPLLGWEITAITIILPVLLIAVANDYGIHMFSKYQEDNVPGEMLTRKQLSARMLQSMGKPILLAGFTTIIGLLCLKGHILIPAGQMGILAAIGIAFALATSLVFIPAVSSLLPKTKPILKSKDAQPKKSIVINLLSGFGKLVSRKPKLVIIFSLLFTALISIGISKVAVNTDPINFYEEDHPVKYSAELINKELGGFFPLSIVFNGDIKDPEVLSEIDEIEKQIQQIPEVGNTTSIARVIRQMSRALNDSNDCAYDKIPDTYNASAQYFELYMMSGEPEDFEKMVDFNFEHAMILVRLNQSSTPVMRKVIKQIKEITCDEPYVEYIGGASDIFSELDINVVRGQFISLGLALAVVFIILLIVFRSFKGAFISILPLVLSMLILFGLMGYLGVELNLTTALLSSIMIGVGIDYTIHFIWRLKEERAAGNSFEQAAINTLKTTGRGIVFNALSVIIGFSALLFSSFIPVKFFGFLVVVSIFACLAGALLLIPAICVLFKPKFLEPKTNNNNN